MKREWFKIPFSLLHDEKFCALPDATRMFFLDLLARMIGEYGIEDGFLPNRIACYLEGDPIPHLCRLVDDWGGVKEIHGGQSSWSGWLILNWKQYHDARAKAVR